MSIKFIEHALSEKLKKLVDAELDLLVYKQNSDDGLEASDILKMEKLSKVFAVLMADTRENRKTDLFKDLSDADLREAILHGEEEEED